MSQPAGPPANPPADVQVFTARTHIRRSPADVLDFCLDTGNFASIMPDRITPLGVERAVVGLGDTIEFRWWMSNVLPIRWVARIDRLEPGHEFVDRQLKGLFRYFNHTHTATPAPGGTLYTDRVEYRSPFGSFLDRTAVRRQLGRTFAHRHRRMRELLEGSG